MADSERIGPYRVIRRLGAGGMGEVVLAHDDRLDRPVAIKRLHDAAATPARRERFRREARIVARLDHPAIVRIHDVHHEAGHDYLIMEYVEGQTLRARCAAQPMTVSEVLDIAHQIALGMAAAHDRGVIHRDLKAENVLITPAGRARLTDFGIAKLEGDDTLTADGAVVGTFRAMSPEQALGRPIDHRSDLFSFGILLHEALAGESPFRAETAFLTVQRLVHDDPRPLAELVPSIPDGLARLVHQLLAKEPVLRPRDFHEVASALIELAGQASDAPHRASSPHGGPPPAGDDTRSTEHSVAPTRPLSDRIAPTRSLPDAAAPTQPPAPATMPTRSDPSSGPSNRSSERPAVRGSPDHVLGAEIQTRPHRGRWRAAVLGAAALAALAALGFAYALRSGDRLGSPPTDGHEAHERLAVTAYEYQDPQVAALSPTVSSAHDHPDTGRDSWDWRPVDLGQGAGSPFWAAWGNKPDDVYFIGRNTMFHHDGTTWKRMDPPRLSPRSVAYLYDIWGSGARDIFVVGEDFTWNNDRNYTFTSVIWHYDGIQWQLMRSGPSRTTNLGATFYHVWGISAHDVYVLMNVSGPDQFSFLLHYDGASWSPMPTGSEARLTAIWGSSRANIIAVGSGTILHYDGEKWEPMDAGIVGALIAVWGSGPKDVYATENGGRVLHYAGTRWKSMDAGTGTTTFWNIWGTGPNDVFLSGGMTVTHYDGTRWRPVKLPMQLHEPRWHVWGTGSQDIYLWEGNLKASSVFEYHGEERDSQ